MSAEALPPSVKRTVLLCWVGWVFDFYDLILIAFLIPAIEQSLGIGPQFGSWLLGIALGASGLGGMVFGWLGDKYGRKPVLTVTIICFSLGMAITALSPNVWIFLACRFLTGLGLGGEWALGHALVAESVPAEQRAKWSARLQSGEPVGVLIAATVGFVVVPWLDRQALPMEGWRLAFLVSSLTGFLALAFRQWMSESPLWLAKTSTDTANNARSVWKILSPFWPLMLLAWVLAVFKLGTYWTCYTWLPRFIKESYATVWGEGYGWFQLSWFAMGQVGQFAGMWVFGHLADAWGRRRSFTVFSLLTAAALIPLALFWTPLLTHNRVLFWGLMLLLGFGSGCTAGFGALLSELFPTGARTLAMGTVYNMARGVQVLAPVLVAYAVTGAGITGGLLVPTSLALLTAAWVWCLPEKRSEVLS